ncbi:hypothetical protein X975_22809, partial [Stegodyphus mimosarum]
MVESSIRIFKGIVLERCKAFNMCSLVEFVCLVIEKYYMKRMLEFANHRIMKPLCMAYKLQTKAKDLDVHPIDENKYYVSSENEKTFYTVLQDMEMC